MLQNDHYGPEGHGPYQFFELGDFDLENGGKLANGRIAYNTLGALNDAKDNAVLFPHMFSGTHKHMEPYVGEGKALDPARYFVILPGQIGNGLSSSPHNTPAPQNMANFPNVTIGDDVSAQYRLVTEQFGIESLQLVLGWSMGAQQTFEWCVRYPEMVKRAAPIGGTARGYPHNHVFVATLQDALRSDPAWNGGFYEEPHAVKEGLRRIARQFAVMGASTEFYKQELWTRIGFDSLEAFLEGFWEAWFAPMDPNDLLCMLWKWDHHDVSRHAGGDLSAALAGIRAKVFNMPFEEDMFFPQRDCEWEAGMIPDCEMKPVPTLWGHFGMFGLFEEDFAFIDRTIGELLAARA